MAQNTPEALTKQKYVAGIGRGLLSREAVRGTNMVLAIREICGDPLSFDLTATGIDYNAYSARLNG